MNPRAAAGHVFYSSPVECVATSREEEGNLSLEYEHASKRVYHVGPLVLFCKGGIVGEQGIQSIFSRSPSASAASL